MLSQSEKVRLKAITKMKEIGLDYQVDIREDNFEFNLFPKKNYYWIPEHGVHFTTTNVETKGKPKEKQIYEAILKELDGLSVEYCGCSEICKEQDNGS
jgi:hypothetical protein